MQSSLPTKAKEVAWVTLRSLHWLCLSKNAFETTTVYEALNIFETKYIPDLLLSYLEQTARKYHVCYSTTKIVLVLFVAAFY